MIEINNGILAFSDFTTKPKIDIKMTDLHLLVTNLSNVIDTSENFPSSLVATAKTYGDGDFKLNGRLNVLKKIPNIDLDLNLENVEFTKLNNFLKAYLNADAEAGTFNLYAEFLMNNGVIDGYVKPVFKNVKFLNPQKKNEKLTDKVWEGITGAIAEIFENQSKDQFATEVPLKGDINKMKVGVWDGIWNVFSNAFIKGFRNQLDYSIGEDVKKGKRKK